MKIEELIVLLFTLLTYINNCSSVKNEFTANCELPDTLIKEIESYRPIVNKIIDTAVNGSFKGVTWQELSNFVDKFGSRVVGSQALDNAVDYMMTRSKDMEFDLTYEEPIIVPKWRRGKESATLLKPRVKEIAMLGLGYSVGTPPEGITAKAIVVKSFGELKKRAAEVPGHIVVYNQKFISYGETVVYRSRGAIEAAKYGAVAVLIRSITPFSIYTPHTGMMDYDDNVKKIPAACITVEDAALLDRMTSRGEQLEINIKMEAKNLGNLTTYNVITQLEGTTSPEKVVVVSGHIDSWDVGQGAMDDGGGLFISWNSLLLLKRLGIKSKRTIRCIMWNAEEFGILGASQYIKAHKKDEKNLQLVMESDIGTFKPLGLAVSGTDLVKCVLQRVLELLEPLGELSIRSPTEGPDIEDWANAGVPAASLLNKNEKYFWYHHTNADTMTVMESDSLDKGTAVFAAVSYVMANLSIDLPRR